MSIDFMLNPETATPDSSPESSVHKDPTRGGSPDGEHIDYGYYYTTQKSLIEEYGLPPGFQYRHLRQSVLRSCSAQHRRLILGDSFSSSCLAHPLPRSLTRRHFASACLVLAFHCTLARGKLPSFWVRCDQRRLLQSASDRMARNYHPEVALLVSLWGAQENGADLAESVAQCRDRFQKKNREM